MARSQTRTLTIALVPAIAAAIFMALVTDAGAERAGRVGLAGGKTRAGVRISADAGRLSGRQVTVACASNADEWAQRLTDVGLPGAADEYYGFSLIHRGEMHLSPYVCEGLRLGASAPMRRSHELQVAWAVNVLIHESVHLARSSPDEQIAEACARVALPRELHRLYRVEYRSAQMRRMTAAAAWFRRTMPPGYQGGICSARGA